MSFSPPPSSHAPAQLAPRTPHVANPMQGAGSATWKGRAAALGDVVRLYVSEAEDPLEVVGRVARELLPQVGGVGCLCVR
jgi:hypothetical protein